MGLARAGAVGEWWRVKTLRIAALCCSLGFLGLVSARAEANWLTDFPKAQAEAKSSHKLLLIDFTGSDWCIWCKRLHAEVFSKPEFQEYAKKNLVLLTADFPRAKPLSAEMQKQNEALAERYQVDSFPTIVVLNGAGQQVGQLGYLPGGPGPFVAELKKLPNK